MAVQTKRSEVRTKTTEGQYSLVQLEPARLVSSLLYGTLATLVLNLLAFGSTKNTQLMTVSPETVRMAKSLPRKNQSECLDMSCHISEHNFVPNRGYCVFRNTHSFEKWEYLLGFPQF